MSEPMRMLCLYCGAETTGGRPHDCPKKPRTVAELEAECVKLAGELADLRQFHADYSAHTAASHRVMVEEVEALRAALAKYGRCRPGCQPVMENPCPCGFQAALEGQP